MGTARSEVRQAFFDAIELDDTFYEYYDETLDDGDIQDIADERANTYIKKAISILKSKCEPEIDFTVDEETDEFNDDLTDDEIQLIGGDLAFEVYIGRDIAKMRTRINTFTSSDLKALHSPANERNSLMAMYKQLQNDNLAKISDYAAKNRITGKYKSPNSEGVDEDDT